MYRKPMRSKYIFVGSLENVVNFVLTAIRGEILETSLHHSNIGTTQKQTSNPTSKSNCIWSNPTKWTHLGAQRGPEGENLSF